MYKAYILSLFDYCDILYHSATQEHLSRLESLQYQAGLTVLGALPSSSTIKVLHSLNWSSLLERRKMHFKKIIYSIQKGLSPSYVANIFSPFLNRAQRQLRPSSRNDYTIPVNFPRQSPVFTLMKTWNDMDISHKTLPSVASLKYKLKSNLHWGTISTMTLNLDRKHEIYLNRARVDCIFKAQLHGHEWTTVDSPNCLCGSPETPRHFFFQCNIRRDHYELFNASITDILGDNFLIFRTQLDKISLFLNGHNSLTANQHDKLFEVVADFLIENL